MRKRTPQGLALILVIITGLFILNKFVLSRSESVSIEEILNTTAYNINKTVPKIRDEFISFDSAVYIPNRQLQFNYTIRNISANDSIIKIIMDSTKAETFRVIKKDAGIKLLCDSNVTFIYLYCDSLGNIIGKFALEPIDYK